MTEMIVPHFHIDPGGLICPYCSTLYRFDPTLSPRERIVKSGAVEEGPGCLRWSWRRQPAFMSSDDPAVGIFDKLQKSVADE
jgi:hypothetical protein